MLTQIKYIVLFIFCFQSCNDVSQTNSENAKEESLNSNMMVKSEEILRDSIKIKITPNVFPHNAEKKSVYTIMNNTAHEVCFDSKFRIERLEESNWRQVPFVENLGFPDFLGRVKAGKEIVAPLHISASIGDEHKQEGTYRLIKEVWLLDDPQKKTLLTVQFTIE